MSLCGRWLTLSDAISTLTKSSTNRLWYNILPNGLDRTFELRRRKMSSMTVHSSVVLMGWMTAVAAATAVVHQDRAVRDTQICLFRRLVTRRQLLILLKKRDVLCHSLNRHLGTARRCSSSGSLGRQCLKALSRSTRLQESSSCSVREAAVHLGLFHV
jgi:hypothetical protein